MSTDASLSRKRPREDADETKATFEEVFGTNPAPSTPVSASAAAAAKKKADGQKGLALPQRKPSDPTPSDGSKSAAPAAKDGFKPRETEKKATTTSKSATIKEDGTIVERKSRKYLDDHAFPEAEAEVLGQSGGPMFGKGYKGGVDSSVQDRTRQDYATALQSRLADDDDF